MGRIKSANHKRTAKKCVSETPEIFTKEFERNKKVLTEIIPHKKTRNSIAGYISRLKKRVN